MYPSTVVKRRVYGLDPKTTGVDGKIPLTIVGFGLGLRKALTDV